MGCTVVALGLGLSQAGAAAPVRRQMKVNVSGPMLASRACGAARQGVSRQAPRAVVVRASDDDKSEEVKYNTEFGYSRKDVLLIGFGLIGGGVLFKWGLEVAGVDPIMAGNYAQLIIFVGLCFGWIGSYLFRVATKQMTYATQLEDYENAVMAKRLEEMPEAEIEELMETIEEEEQRRGI
mmetsp:Transcript_9543/g.25952  ORF Transcript_9543/g.25952 Transcript_9543/m.25952 type:complete len:180 (-) Transcript_9543:31-570(-)